MITLSSLLPSISLWVLCVWKKSHTTIRLGKYPSNDLENENRSSVNTATLWFKCLPCTCRRIKKNFWADNEIFHDVGKYTCICPAKIIPSISEIHIIRQPLYPTERVRQNWNVRKGNLKNFICQICFMINLKGIYTIQVPNKITEGISSTKQLSLLDIVLWRRRLEIKILDDAQMTNLEHIVEAVYLKYEVWFRTLLTKRLIIPFGKIFYYFYMLGGKRKQPRQVHRVYGINEGINHVFPSNSSRGNEANQICRP